MTVIYDIFKVSVEQQARNNLLLKKALRARSKRACLLLAVFLIIMAVVLSVVAWILARKAALIGNFDERLQSVEQTQVQNDFYERIRDLERKLATIQDFQGKLKK